MPKFMCSYSLPSGQTCNIISDKGRCPLHRTNTARGYGTEHQKSRALAVQAAPYCWNCGCPQETCKLQWHHVTELRGGRNPEKDNRRQLLCVSCHNKVKEKQNG
jgi:5-methylcytosine-specific restriction endonuclease McrA